MTEDRQARAESVVAHVHALARLHQVWGAFGLITGASLVILAVGTQAAALTAGSVGPSEIAAESLLGLGAVALVSGGLAMWLTGRALARRSSAGRLVALALAVPNLLLLPFGTALGVYAFWALLNDDARRLFGAR